MPESEQRTICPTPASVQDRQTDVRSYLVGAKGLTPAEVADLLGSDQVWRWRRGERVPVEAYLQIHPALAADNDEALDLVLGEVMLREQMGETPLLEEYLWRFPQFAAQLRSQFELHRALNEVEPVRASFAGEEESVAGRPKARPAQRASRKGDFPSLAGYVITGELGRGGMGVVYRAWQERLNRPVALKMILGGSLASPEAHDRFLREAEAVARLQHPNIVQVYDIGEQSGQPFLALELVEGVNLGERIRGIPQSPEGAARLIETLARAIGYAHRSGVIHRDLKPTNVLVGGEPTSSLAQCTPKIADFGLAKQISRVAPDAGPTTESGVILGTAEYMAPEQAACRSDAVGRGVDVYALGAMLYELLTGRPPFKGATSAETILQVIHEEPVPPRRLQPRVPRDLETVCLKCLEKDARKRFVSAEELADDLRRFQDGKPVRARPVGLVGRGWRWCRRRPAVAFSLSAVVLTVAAAFVALLFLNAQTTEAWTREEAARRKAEDRDKQTRQILPLLLRLNQQTTYHPPEGRESQRLEQLKQAADNCESLLHEAPTDVTLLTSLACIYDILSKLHYDNWEEEKVRTNPARVPSSRNSGGKTAVDGSAVTSLSPRDQRGHLASALAYKTKVVGLTRRVVEAQPHGPDYRGILTEAYLWQAHLHRCSGDGEQALAAFRNACELRQAMAAEKPTPELRYQLARVQLLLCEMLYASNRAAEASRLAAVNLKTLRQLLADQPAQRRFRDQLSQIYVLLGSVHRGQGLHSEALGYFQQAYDLWKAWLRQRPSDPEAKKCLGNIAVELTGQDAVEPFYTEAVAYFEADCESLTLLAEREPTNPVLRRNLEYKYVALARCHEKGGQPSRRAAAWERYVRFLEGLEKRGSGEESLRPDLEHAYADLAVYYREAGDVQKAARFGQQAFELVEARRPKDSPGLGAADQRFQWASRAWILAHSIRGGGLPEKALVLAEHSRQIFVDLVRESPQDQRYGIGLYRAYEEVARAHVKLDRPDEALAAYLKSVEVLSRVIEQEPTKLVYHQLLAGRCLSLSHHFRDRGRFSEAADWLLEREKHLPADAANLRLVSQEFTLLAAKVGGGRTQLSPAEEAERQRYLQLSERPASAVPAWVPPPQGTGRQ
jgi:tetratricopeptide (TPR) repeat protein